MTVPARKLDAEAHPLRKAAHELDLTAWVLLMERLFSDRIVPGVAFKPPGSTGERILCAWKDLKDVANELEANP